jgi:myosin heavy subunit
MKLHFDDKASKIVRASVDHYLLERSRITQHEIGERGYHVFYQLVGGADSKLSKKLGLIDSRFRYLAPQDHSEPTRKKSGDGPSDIPSTKTTKEVRMMHVFTC